MNRFTSVNDPEISRILQSGGIGVLRTDTLYGIVAKADNKAAVERVFRLKGRDDNKSPIVLVASPEQLFDQPSNLARTYLSSVWPGPVSVIIPSDLAPDWLTRGNKSVAYRLPNENVLCSLIVSTGPLIAPSANPQGADPAVSIEQAEAYFGRSVDFYVDGGVVTDATPSMLVRLSATGEVVRLR